MGKGGGGGGGGGWGTEGEGGRELSLWNTTNGVCVFSPATPFPPHLCHASVPFNLYCI